MEFFVLGQFDVRRAGRRCELSRVKPKLLLALLLANANRCVPAGSLRAELWGPHPPTSATANLQTYVWSIRRLLATEPGPPRLVSGDLGYRLTVADAELDALRHERLAAAGRAALERGDLERGVGLLDQAALLWRGRPLGSLPPTPALERWADALEERQRALVHDWTDARLALGQSDELVGELRQGLTRQPLCERQHAQLMLALYRAGRCAEALDAYAGARRTLAEELGVAPGPALSRIQHAILTHDPVLTSRDVGNLLAVPRD